MENTTIPSSETTNTPVLINKRSGAKLWSKGQSGNPSGRPKGAKNKMKELAEGLIGKDAKKIVKKIIDLALDGNEACLKMCLDRIIPAQKAIDIATLEKRNSEINIIIGGIPENKTYIKAIEEINPAINVTPTTLEINKEIDEKETENANG